MTKADRDMIKSTLERIADVMKYTTGGEQGAEPTSGPLSATTDSPTRLYSTESKTYVGGPRRPLKREKVKLQDYGYGQRGKNEAGKTKPGITGLPTEPTQLVNTRFWTEHGTPYSDSNL